MYKFCVIVFIGCLVVGMWRHAWGSEFGPFHGKILDADTREPVEGVVVLIEWRQYRLSSLFENTIFYDAQETLSDKNGEFYISGIWILNPWTRLMLESHVIIYKSGYYGIHVPWGSLLKPWGEPIAGERRTYVLEVEDGKPVIMLKKVIDIDERWKNVGRADPGSDIPDEKVKLLMNEINKEKENLRKIKP